MKQQFSNTMQRITITHIVEEAFRTTRTEIVNSTTGTGTTDTTIAIKPMAVTAVTPTTTTEEEDFAVDEAENHSIKTIGGNQTMIGMFEI